ncbi:hypothetical protein [Leptolyngbya ohadii]|uniref:hypothetical protein n=1 Tax=Leptolyngbya ohadii TaxID=1962290 RepID=UPI000B59855C|nr:hypothetical protein [Leptolyngbya ohadii]
MLILNAQILESQGIPYRAASKILFQERLFVKRQTFSQRVKQVAINLYEEYVNSGIPCLLIESTEQITFWRELQPEFAHPTATPGSRSPQFPISNSSQAAKLPKYQSPKYQSPKAQAKDAIRIEMPYRESIWSSQKPTSQKTASQKPLTRTRQGQSSRTAVSSPKIGIDPALTTPVPATKISTLPAHLRRLTYR